MGGFVGMFVLRVGFSVGRDGVTGGIVGEGIGFGVVGVCPDLLRNRFLLLLSDFPLLPLTRLPCFDAFPRYRLTLSFIFPDPFFFPRSRIDRSFLVV